MNDNPRRPFGGLIEDRLEELALDMNMRETDTRSALLRDAALQLNNMRKHIGKYRRCLDEITRRHQHYCECDAYAMMRDPDSAMG